MKDDNEIKICSNHPEYQVPLIWTFKFPGAEYWCPFCGYTSGIFGAGKNVIKTEQLDNSKKEWMEKVLPYLRSDTDKWEYNQTI